MELILEGKVCALFVSECEVCDCDSSLLTGVTS